ncbi:hypothetical protein BDV27DRAFT_147981 [Aspergillus caelatus]|uniref:Adenosine deaminase domain-containing protein n=1 Tax=Aspergillus caelatus TaxID=61420 RepID=A0A5N6ZUI1_9EURO|nr:uncharacterized protein BDV27DRAFT_147981 [Aspergillus caelatus]KAE8361271.1 hypothetical protein BDV27DRAFT_147981 [Aspergillus caelatus]
MTLFKPFLSNVTIREYRDLIRDHDDEFIQKIPKAEMHVHIEGTMTPETPIPKPGTGKPCHVLAEGDVEGGTHRFFQLYCGGFDVFREEEYFCYLALNYFQRAVQFQWIMCFLRDMSPESAMSHHIDALPFRDMIVGIGLEFLERGRPSLLFEDVFERARDNHLKITCHCDFGAKHSLRHVAQAVDQLGETGAGRIDHGLHKGLGLTIRLWGYLCYIGESRIPERMGVIHDAGIKIVIGSDDPACMEDIRLKNTLYMLCELCQYAVDICWASTTIETQILEELQEYLKQVL